MRILGINSGMIAGIGDWLVTVLSRLLSVWPLSWRSVNALIMGILLAKWFWIFLAPQPTFTASAVEPLMSMEEGRIFGITQSSGPANQGNTLPNVQLLGVFTASAGKRGFAVIKVDAKRQIGVAEGEEAAPGTKLVEVRADHVTLERGGVKYRIDLVSKPADSTIANKIAPPDYTGGSGNKKN